MDMDLIANMMLGYGIGTIAGMVTTLFVADHAQQETNLMKLGGAIGLIVPWAIWYN
jgi:gas vesicle protein